MTHHAWKYVATFVIGGWSLGVTKGIQMIDCNSKAHL